MAENSSEMYKRWDMHQRIQHWIVISSFTMLSITGIPIKFAYEAWAQSYARIFGSFEVLYGIHKIGAAMLMILAVYHVMYLIIKAVQGKLRWSMFPIIKDFKDFAQNISYYLGLSKERPLFKKYSYKEKMDYWAVYWGSPIMIFSGLLIWFPGYAASKTPKWVIDSSHFFHQDEGMLAILFIFSIHFYNVHFSPDFFPMNYTWLTGKVSKEVMEHEYPLELDRIEKEGESVERKIQQKRTLTD